MSGNAIGAAKAKATIEKRYGKRFWKKIGSAGGSTSHLINPETGKAIKGFALSGKAQEAGRLGGTRSRRGKAKKVQ